MTAVERAANERCHSKSTFMTVAYDIEHIGLCPVQNVIHESVSNAALLYILRVFVCSWAVCLDIGCGCWKIIHHVLNQTRDFHSQMLQTLRNTAAHVKN